MFFGGDGEPLNPRRSGRVAAQRGGWESTRRTDAPRARACCTRASSLSNDHCPGDRSSAPHVESAFMIRKDPTGTLGQAPLSTDPTCIPNVLLVGAPPLSTTSPPPPPSVDPPSPLLS